MELHEMDREGAPKIACRPDVVAWARVVVTRSVARLSWIDRAAFALPVLVFLGVYGVAAGHGFVSDDFQWISQSRVRSAADLLALWHKDNGFYRPVVSLSFAIDEWLFGLHARGYGLTNVAIALACFWSIVRLARALRMPMGGAWLAGAVWLLNLQFIRMGVLWVSGRTSLLAVLFSTLAATSLVRNRAVAATLWLTLALFSKEEALPVAVILVVWLAMMRRSWLPWAAGATAAVAVYLLGRAATHAMTPATAPSFYHYVWAPSAILGNVLEYADRSMTLAVVTLLLALACLGWARRRAEATGDESPAAAMGVVWLVLAFAPTILLPIRSDLYACLPAVGAALAAGAIVARAWQGASADRRRRAVMAAVVFALVLAPVHALRTTRRVGLAELSSQALGDLRTLTASLPDGAIVRIDDDPTDPHRDLGDAFGPHLSLAFEVETGRRLDLRIAAADAPDRASPCGECALRLALANGRLRLVH
jgi:hypothetical protein